MEHPSAKNSRAGQLRGVAGCDLPAEFRKASLLFGGLGQASGAADGDLCLHAPLAVPSLDLHLHPEFHDAVGRQAEEGGGGVGVA